MGDVFLNLLSDKIAITYGSLNAEPQFDAGFNRYTTVNDFAFIDNEGLLCINITPSLFINCKTMVFIDPETGEDLEVLPYIDMSEEEFFQFTTVYDFGMCDFDDIAFTKKHICALQSMAGKFREKASEQFRKMQAEWEREWSHAISSEIDNELLRQLTTSDWDPIEISLLHSPKQIKLSSMPLLTDTLVTQILINSSVSFNAMNKGNP